MSSSSTESVPRWIPRVLYFAAVYNLAWGLFVILFPRLPFAWAGMTAPNYPAIVQCLGMVIGVYGIGYALAARDPVTHWPIVLVGLLGKIFGPIGFVWAASQGEFPWLAGLTILTNDVAWWLPFSAILVYAARGLDARKPASTFEQALAAAVTDQGTTLKSLSDAQPTFVLFIRHAGCTFCREALADLHRASTQLKDRGMQLVVVHMNDFATGRALLDRFGLTDVPQISDPERTLYRAFDLPLGTFQQLFGPYVIWKALTGTALYRHGFGPIAGNAMQLGGAFVVHRGRVVGGYRYQTTADRPDFCALPTTAQPA